MGRTLAAAAKIRRMRHPLVTITPPPDGIVFERDVPVPMRDGTLLRANVFRPETPGRYPAIVSAHPYVKARLPRRRHRGGYPIPRQYRLPPPDQAFSHSAWTYGGAPAPASWVTPGSAAAPATQPAGGRSAGT